jgi:hypothetical protein
MRVVCTVNLLGPANQLFHETPKLERERIRKTLNTAGGSL